MNTVILRPIISEKSAALAELGGQYVFEVMFRANKIEIRKAVEKEFSVEVEQVRTMVMQRERRKTQRGWIKPIAWKKAIVRLKSGQKIDIAQLSS